MPESFESRYRPGCLIGGQYQLKQLLQLGPFMETWEAEDAIFDRRVLLKCLPEQLYRHTRFRARLQQVFSRTQELKHPGVVSFYHLGHEKDHASFIVSNFIREKNLTQLMEAVSKKSVPFPIPSALHILWQVACILDHAHEQQVAHSSLKPNNIFVTSVGEVQLTDFWISSEIRLALDKQGIFFQRPLKDYCYLSPEQLTHKMITRRSDQFALAVIAYQLLAGELPWQKSDIDDWREKVTSHPVIFPHSALSDALETFDRTQVATLLHQGLTILPDHRFTSCKEFMDRLIRCFHKREEIRKVNDSLPDIFNENQMSQNIPQSDRVTSPHIEVQTTQPVSTVRVKTDPRQKQPPQRNSSIIKYLSWSINLLLLLCVCAVAYTKRDTIVELMTSKPKSSANAGLSGLVPQETLDIPVPPKHAPVKPPLQETHKQEESHGISFDARLKNEISYESQRENYFSDGDAPYPGDAPDAETETEDVRTDDVVEDSEIMAGEPPFETESEDREELSELVIKNIQSDANLVYQTGFVFDRWDARNSKMRDLFKTQFKIWKRGVEHDVPEACYLLGLCYTYGYGSASKSKKKAFEMYLKSAEGGFPPSQFEVALCYQKGSGVARHDSQANLWFEKAEKNDEVRALYNKALSLIDSGHIPTAMDILTKLSQKGFQPATQRLN